MQTVNKLQAGCSCVDQPDKAHFDKVLAAPVPIAQAYGLVKDILFDVLQHVGRAQAHDTVPINLSTVKVSA